MSESLFILPEPQLEFRFNQRLVDPHDGLALFGPYSTDFSSHPKNIIYGVLGTPEGINAFKKWSETMMKPILTDKKYDSRLWPHYPGFDAIFYSTWPVEPALHYEIDRTELINASRNLDPNKRACDVVDLYLSGLKIAKKHDESFDVLICVVPDAVYKNCRPISRIQIQNGFGFPISEKEKYLRAEGQLDFFGEYEPEQYQLSVDFRRQIKARTMEYGIPIQIIRESTLELNPFNERDRDLTPLSDRAWNLSTALYYKSGGKPWKLSNARKGVCYIGLAFRKTDPITSKRTACCAAQMFLDTGDGIVFLGEYGPWYSPTDRQFHLTKDSARKLLKGVLNTYNDLDGRKLNEIFLHSRSTISNEEFEGYKQACPSGIKVIGIRVRLDRFGIRLFRPGIWPVIRGTFLKINNRTGYLWASGFKPRLGTYDGWEIPVPLRIDLEHGQADIKTVAQDIFSLSKLNYNACKLGESQPVTIHFSDAVGEILVSNPSVLKRLPNFKFYI